MQVLLPTQAQPPLIHGTGHTAENESSSRTLDLRASRSPAQSVSLCKRREFL